MKKLPRGFSITQEAQVRLDHAGKYIVYLLHFERPVLMSNGRTMTHYIGLTSNLPQRMQQHISGQSWPVIRQAWKLGIKITITRIWNQDGHFERKVKNHRNHWRHCPHCRVNRGLKPIPNRKNNERKIKNNQSQFITGNSVDTDNVYGNFVTANNQANN